MKFKNYILMLLLMFFSIKLYPETTSQIDVKKIVKNFKEGDRYKKTTELCYIMKNHGSDKSLGHHNYTTLYYDLFNCVRNENLDIFELGLGTNYIDIPSNMGKNGIPGASLFGWREFFPNSQIYGADIDKRILFNSDRILTFYCDQKNSDSINKMLNTDELKDVLFDIIIEDGLHEFDANFSFLVNMIKGLKKGGIYIIEDLQLKTRNKFKKIIKNLIKDYNLNYCEIVEISGANTTDNCLLVIQK